MKSFLFVIVGLFAAQASFAQSKENLRQMIYCTAGYGDADSHFTLELLKDNADGALFVSVQRVSDGEKKPVDFVPVKNITGVTGIVTLSNAAGNYKLILIHQDGQLQARLTDVRNNKSKPGSIFFDECSEIVN